MSFEAIRSVLEHSSTKGAARMVLFALAYHAHPDGTGAWPSVQKLQAETALCRRSVQEALRKLEGLGEIERAGRHDSGKTIYTVRIVDEPRKVVPLPTARMRGAAPAGPRNADRDLDALDGVTRQ
jgi:hypothetical protein